MQPGTRIDDFTIAYRIASGMNSDVFAVWHHKLLTPLVCKRLRAADTDYLKWRRLLLREGATLAKLNHPGVVRLIEQNRRATLPYILLEHVGSKTLRDRLREEGRLPTGEAVRIVQHTGAALVYAHNQGYLHRDLKPSNIIMRNGRPVLIDWGVAYRYVNARRPPDRAGTPQRLAPEQINREPLTPRTDVYGLGMLLFELLTAQRPFPPSPHAHDYDAQVELRYSQLTHKPLTLAEAGCDAAPDLQRIITQALEVNPAKRFASVAELLTALDPFTEIKIYPLTERPFASST